MVGEPDGLPSWDDLPWPEYRPPASVRVGGNDEISTEADEKAGEAPSESDRKGGARASMRKSSSWDQLKGMAKKTAQSLRVSRPRSLSAESEAKRDNARGGAVSDTPTAAGEDDAVKRVRGALRASLQVHPMECVIDDFFEAGASNADVSVKTPWSTFHRNGIGAEGLRRAAAFHGCDLNEAEAARVVEHFGGVVTRRGLRALCEGEEGAALRWRGAGRKSGDLDQPLRPLNSARGSRGSFDDWLFRPPGDADGGNAEKAAPLALPGDTWLSEPLSPGIGAA